MSKRRFFFESDDDLQMNFDHRFKTRKMWFWMISNLRRWIDFDDNHSSRHEHYRTHRCRRNIKFDYAINSINWRDIEIDRNDIEILKYRSFFTRNSRWLWQNRKIRWFDFRKNHKNFCVKINNETHHKFALFQIIQIDKSCSYVLTFCMNQIFCHQICRII